MAKKTKKSKAAKVKANKAKAAVRLRLTEQVLLLRVLVSPVLQPY